MLKSFFPSALLSVAIASPLAAAERRASVFAEEFPYQKACISLKSPENKANKGIAIRLGTNASVCFDTDQLRMAGGWTGGFINAKGVTFDGSHGGNPEMVGDQKFGTKAVAGWAGADANFTEERSNLWGPISENLGRWDGLYVHGEKVVLTYTILGTKIAEQPGAVTQNGETVFERVFQMEAAREPLSLLVADFDVMQGTAEGQTINVTAGAKSFSAKLIGAPKDAKLIAKNNRVIASFPKGAAGTFKLVVWSGEQANQAKAAALGTDAPKMVDFKKGGASRWKQEVVTKGVLQTSATPDGAYVTDTLTAPENNPWNRRIRFGGLDFFPDGKRAALSTWDGDVWIVSGIDDKLEKLTWKRFACGGFETLGLKIVDGIIYTSGRDEITRYHDVNNDGEADYYENFNNQITSSPGFHEFPFDLQTDSAGNFYMAKAAPVRGGGRGFGGGGGNGDVTKYAGTVMKVSKDGKKMEVYADGFRAPNGIGVGPDGQVTTGDNEGTWVPACPLNWVRQGGFYGVEETGEKELYGKRDKPLMWLHHGTYDNSGGGQVWVTSDKWGPYKGELLHMSYGQCAIYLISKENVNGVMQGGAIRIPVKFTSSAMRARFSPADGQLYVAGLQGWQTKATKLAGLDRIRYTGKPVYSVQQMKVAKDKLVYTFTQPLDAASAGDVQNFSAQQWNYEVRYVDDKVVAGKITRAANFNKLNYGGHEVNGSDLTKVGRETVEIRSAQVSGDGKTLTLEVPGLKPVHQLLVKFNVKAKDGKDIKQEVLQTINAIP